VCERKGGGRENACMRKTNPILSSVDNDKMKDETETSPIQYIKCGAKIGGMNISRNFPQ
jgi:hypothetical protein